MSIGLMVCDDQRAIQLGVESLVGGSEIEVAWCAASGEEAVHLVSSFSPDAILLDIRLGQEDGLEVLQEIKRAKPSIPVIIFSVDDELNDLARAHRLGADGYCLKTVSRDDLLQIIRRAVAGKRVWTTAQIRRIKSRGGAKAGDERKRNPLSDREQQVLAKIIEGAQSNEMIAEDLEIDVETVKQYVRSILKKIHVEDRTQAALWGLRHHFGSHSAS
jgi:DNA-binding NarL/FixJ family response regulator